MAASLPNSIPVKSEVSNTDLPAYAAVCINAFENQVRLTPDAPCLIFDKSSLTYNQVNRRANQLAHYILENYGVSRDCPIGIMLERSEQMVIGILAILKTGGAYVPIDVDNPVAYSQFIIKDCNLKVVLTDKEFFDKALFEGIAFINLNNSDCYSVNESNLNVVISPNDLMYIIYTSGSTGVPKGVMLENRSVMNRLNWMQQQFCLTAEDTVLHKTNYIFDVSVWEIFWPLLNGSKLCLLQPGAQSYPDKIIDMVLDAKVTMVHFVPPMLQVFLDYLQLNPDNIPHLKSIRNVFSSGEALTPNQVNLFNRLLFKNLGIALINKYGPTEAAIDVSYYWCESTDEVALVPIGKPIDNTEFYIVNEKGDLVPDGEKGELWIGGIQVARGYLNRPELTNDRFIQNPFKPEGRVYKTGDSVCRLDDGNLLFFGRIDNQIKINGFRVEPGAIEKNILENEYIKECYVTSKYTEGTATLTAYVTMKNGWTDTSVSSMLKKYLSMRLPAYMLPASFIVLKVFPVTSSGKIDRKSLPLTNPELNEDNHVASPLTPTQNAIEEIFKKNLDLAHVGLTDDFFDLGGSSLKVISVIAQINQLLGTNLPLMSLYQLPTIKALADELEIRKGKDISPIVCLREGEGMPWWLLPGWRDYPIVFNDFVKDLPGDQPVYSVIYPEDGENFKFNTLQEYCEYLLVHFKKLQPTGPYALLGHSMGGRVAFELALQMQLAGDDVKSLVILSAFPEYPLKGSIFQRKLSDELRTFLKINIPLKTKYIRFRIPNSVKYFFMRKLKIEHPREERGIYSRMFTLYDTYVLNGKFNGDILLFMENENRIKAIRYKRIEVYRNSIIPDLWKKHIIGHVHVRFIDCQHTDFLSRPGVSEIAIQSSLFNNR